MLAIVFEALIRYGLIGLVVVAGAIWAIVGVRALAPRAHARGGEWYLEVLLFLSAPVLTSLVFLYPADLSGPFPAAARAISLICVGLAVWSLIHSASKMRRGVGPIVCALIAFYLATILSGIVGATPGIPEPYITTPIVVLAFVVNGGYSQDWLLRAVGFNLRVVLALSFLCIVVMPSSAFNSDESRTFLGVERLQGIVGHPNSLGALAVVAVLLELRSRRSKFWTALPLVALALAQSNSAWIAFLLALAIQSGLLSKFLRYVAVCGAVVLAAGAIVWPSIAAPMLASLSGDNFTFNGRSKIWDAAMEGFHLYPVFGYGPTLLDDKFRSLYLPNFEAASQAHNQFVQSLAGAGLIGLLALVALWIVLYSRAIRLRRFGQLLPIALLVALSARAFSETPLKPSGPGLQTFLLVVVVATIATMWSERSFLPKPNTRTPEWSGDSARLSRLDARQVSPGSDRLLEMP
jgi:O-antigen ligase